MAWSRSIPGSEDYEHWVCDPSDPASARLAYQGRGAVHPTDFSPDGRKLLLLSGNAARSELWLLELASGKATPIAARDGQQFYDDANFLDAGHIIILSGKD